jgi:hypothetical protein
MKIMKMQKVDGINIPFLKFVNDEEVSDQN